jgi:hypothetical protein
MSASFSVDSYGLQDALKKMQKIDPALRRAVLKDIKLAAQPLVTAINNRIPAQAPLKGNESQWAHRLEEREESSSVAQHS